MMTNIIVVIILMFITGSTGLYLYRAKKRGEHCIGCPYAKQCAKKSCKVERTVLSFYPLNHTQTDTCQSD